MTTIYEALAIQKALLELQGYSVCYIALNGSQNYGMALHTDDYQSDIDMKAVIVPTLDDLISNSKPVSTSIETEWGKCDLKDIRSYFQVLLKANPAYIETLYTKYYIIDDKFTSEFDEIFRLKDKLVETLSAQFLRSMYGMMCEKEKAMCHPYPTIKHKIDEFGYDGKQVSHAHRLLVMMNDYFVKRIPLEECFFPSIDFDLIMDLKLNKPSLDGAKSIMKTTMQRGKALRNKVLDQIDETKIDYSIKNDFLTLSQSIVKNKIIEDIKRGEQVCDN